MSIKKAITAILATTVLTMTLTGCVATDNIRHVAPAKTPQNATELA